MVTLNRCHPALTGPAVAVAVALLLSGVAARGACLKEDLPERRWPNGVIPYTIDESLDDYKANVLEAIKAYNEKTVIRFVPRTEEADYVLIQFSKAGSQAQIGRRGGQQWLHLSQSGARNVPVIMHELGHTIGLIHEHQRPDRDDSITIDMQNVKPGLEKQFTIIQSPLLKPLSPYDVESIMQYPPLEFSAKGQPTMIDKRGKPLPPWRQKSLSSLDISSINAIVKSSTVEP